MFNDIYVSIQASQVLQERWQQEVRQTRVAWLASLLRRTAASK